ncbi:AMP-binding protein [Novosphingobium aquimarinum]|uniref:AMP-binding protein n=1 Tax=Novosphingobium aquimarinum TaxID=2682494 RepID=UPI0018DB1CCF|nr:AMP-binding protein [Novosphingobium aquimarinum]
MIEMFKDASGWPVRVAADFAAEGRWSNETLMDWARRRVAEAPDVTAVVEGNVRLTYAALDHEARRIAAAFMAAGLKRGDVVSFQLPNWWEAVPLNLAIVYAGLIANPIVPIYRDAELRFILRDARSKVYIAPQQFRNVNYEEMAARFAADCPDLRLILMMRSDESSCSRWEDFVRSAPDYPSDQFFPVDPDAIKLVMYTSGTTGKAKGVLHTHNSINTTVKTFQERCGLHAGDAVFMPSPVTHITGYLFALELSFVAGIKAILTDRWVADEAVRLIDEEAATFSVGTTPFLTELIAASSAAGTRLPSLRFYMCGGAAVPPDLIRRGAAAFERAAVFRVYGATEAPDAALGPPLDGDQNKGAITDGQITNYAVRIVDPESGAPLANGEEGEITLFGPQMMVGYSREEDNHDAFTADGYVRTGDLGWVDDDGFLTITGRAKDLINRGGEKFSPKEIEDLLHAHPDIADVAIVAMPHARLGEMACAFVVSTGKSIDLPSLIAFLEESGIARQKFPERLEIVESLPMTASGKVRKNILRDSLNV